MYDTEAEKPFEMKQGMGIKYQCGGKDYISESFDKRKVRAVITSYVDMAFDAEHYYCKLSVMGLWAKEVGQKDNSVTSTWDRPKEMRGIEVEITYIPTKNLRKRGMMGTEMSIKKGERTHRFDDLKLLKSRAMEELKRLFPKDEGWEWDTSDLEIEEND